MIRPRSSGPRQHRAVAVETLERRRLLAATPLVEFTAPTYSTDAVPAPQIAGAYASFQIAEPGSDFAAGTVDYTVGGGTATPGVDYQPVHGTATLNAGNNYGVMLYDQATAQFSTASLGMGAHTITASYSGDATTGTSTEITGETIGSTSPTLTVQTAAPTPTASDVELFYSSAAPVAGQPFLLVATTWNPATLPVVPTGQVQFLDGNTVLGTLPLDAAGNAVFYFPALAAGTHLFHLVYGGDTNYAASLTATATLVATVPTPPAVTTIQRGSQTSATVTLGFSGPLDPTVARKASNYRITTPGGRAIKVKSAIYDPTAVTVTLHLASRLNPRLAYGIHVAAGGTTYTGVIPRLLYFGVTPRSMVSSAAITTAAATPHPHARLATPLHVAARWNPARAVR